MPRMRKVMISIEATTCLRVEELRDLKALVFTSLKGRGRRAIKPPLKRAERDTLGTIDQVQINVVKS